MVADLSSTPTPPPKPNALPPAKPKRVPLVTNNNNDGSMHRRPKHKDIPSRYLSYSNTISTTQVTSQQNHPRTVELSASSKMLTKTSARSLSVSFQGESFALPVSKVGKQANNDFKNCTREKKKATDNVMTVLQKTITAKTKLDHIKPDIITDETKLKHIKPETIIDETKLEHIKRETVRESDESDHADSDPESVSSGSTLGQVGGGPRAIMVPARFWKETINLLRRVQPVAVSAPQPLLLKTKKMSFGRKVVQDGAKVAPGGRGVVYCPTLLKDDGLGNTVSILSICADAKRGKVGEKKLVDAHVLRVLHNKHMQWRFANARVDAAMVVQRAAAQKTLYNAWVTISKLWHSVISKRLQLQQLKHNLKLHSLLKKQMLHLDNWDITDRDYSISLAGAITALESSSLCLPVLSGAKADIQNLKDAICSANDVMQDMSVSICSLVTKVENVNLMASELANAMKTECSLLDQCKDLLSTLTLLEQQDCSLRAHTLQLIPEATMTQGPKIMPF